MGKTINSTTAIDLTDESIWNPLGDSTESKTTEFKETFNI